MLSTLGPDGAATLVSSPERLRQVNDEVEAMGVKVLEQFALLGGYDFLNIIEAPDEKAIARVAIAVIRSRCWDQNEASGGCIAMAG